MTEYDQIVFIDADIVFVSEASEMFSPYWLPLSIYAGRQNVCGKYNTGVMILQPNTEVS